MSKTVKYDTTKAPESYAELFEVYGDFAANLTHKLGISRSNAPDVSRDILVRFYERDFLNVFDPNKVITYNGRACKPNFRSFLSAFIALYCRGHRDMQAKRAKHEVLTEYLEPGSGDSYFPDFTAGVEAQRTAEKIRAHLRTVPRRDARDACDLVRLFDLVVDLSDSRKGLSTARVARELSICPTTAKVWLERMRFHAAEALGYDPRKENTR